MYFEFNLCSCYFDELPVWNKSFTGSNRRLAAVVVAALIWAIWRTRNDACFKGVLPQDPINIVYLMTHFVSFWTDLQK